MSQFENDLCTLGATDAYIGSTSLIAVQRPTDAHFYTLQYTFGELSGFIDAQGGTVEKPVYLQTPAVAFLLPEGFYDQIPECREGQCSLVCSTFLEGVQTGQTQTQFRAMADPGVCVPVLDAQVVDCNPLTLTLTGDERVLVRYASTARCTANAQAQKGARLVQLTVQGQPMTEGCLDIAGVEQGTFTFTALDSRGFSGQVTVERSMLGYYPPTAGATARRADPATGAVELQVWGNYYPGSFGASDNTLTASVELDGQWLLLEVTPDGGAYRASGTVTGLDYNMAYQLNVQVSDSFQTVQCSAYVGRAEPVFDWGETDFAFHVPVTAPSFNDTDVKTLYRGFCLDANDARETGTYRMIPESTNTPVDSGILVSFFCGDLTLQLAANEDGSKRYMRLLQTTTAHAWTEI